jgi:WD40 repeat protein/tRNA A-37 threonylcarbamoyl transferase component Bud32
LKQRYRLVAQVGKGGFGAVYQAEDCDLGNRLVAVKEMQPNGLRSQELQEATEAFRREALLLAGLAHPNLPRIYDHFSEDGRWYLVMDFIEGETLEAYLGKAPGGRLPLGRALEIGLHLCAVLEYLHTRQPPIIFRDLKPSNVLLTADDMPHLVDFGIARLFKPGQAKDTVAFGSPGYAAPEQYGKAQTTPRSDIYGLGALLHHLLTGNDPSETPFRFAPLSDPALAGIGGLIAQMVQLDEASRPASMAEVKRELEALAAGAANGQRASRQIVGAGQPQPSQQQAAPPADTRRSVLLRGVGMRVLKGVLPTYKGHRGRVNTLAWSPDGARIVSGGADRTAQVWDVTAGKTLWTYRAALKWVLAVDWSPDGGLIVVGGASPLSWWHNPVLVLDAETGKKLLKYTVHFKWILAVDWSPDGQRVASASGGLLSRWDDIVHVWDAARGTTLSSYSRHANTIHAVAWSPDGSRIASGSADGTVQVWDAATAQPLLTCRGDRWNGVSVEWSPVRALAWSPDGKRIASACDQVVQVWEADAQKPVGTRSWVHFGIRTVRMWENDKPLLMYHGHSQRVLAVAWSPDGLHLASGGDDGTAQVWDADTGEARMYYQGHMGPVSAIAWSPDGKHIASGGADRTVQVWDAR